MHPRELREAYERNENITALLKTGAATTQNTEEMIETAYDLQAGSYIASLSDPRLREHTTNYGKALANEIRSLTKPTSILEAGVGEATTLSFVLDGLADAKPLGHGFDISWSRIAHGRGWLAERGHREAVLTVASLFHLPYRDASFDVVYTSHTIEPNGGNEERILRELHRITSRFLILLEPAYELASPEARARMESHGYCRGLVEHATRLGMRVVKHELFAFSANPLNPTGLIVIERERGALPAIPSLACPKFGDALEDRGDALFSPGSLRAYPKIRGIPCLRQEDAVIASAFEKFHP